MDWEAYLLLAGALMADMLRSMFSVEPEGNGWCVMERWGSRESRIARYIRKENAEKHVKRLQEKWG